MNQSQTKIPLKPLWSFDEEKDALELVKLLKESGIHAEEQKRGGSIWPKTWVLVGAGEEAQARNVLTSGRETLSHSSLELKSVNDAELEPRTNRITKLHHVFSVLFFGLVPVSLVFVRLWGKKEIDSVPDLHGLPAIIISLWLISLVAATLGILFSRCPLCGKMFHFRPGVGNPLARKCVHCSYGLNEKKTFT